MFSDLELLLSRNKIIKSNFLKLNGIQLNVITLLTFPTRLIIKNYWSSGKI
jgi:hypothetical protein